MYGEKAVELINHIRREQSDLIPPYKFQLIEDILRENDELYAENLRTSQSTTSRVETQENGSRGTYTPDDKAPKDSGSQENEVEKEATNTQDDIDISEKEIHVMQIRHTAKLWNKRCYIAYHYERLNRLKRLRWEFGNNLPREIVQNLTKSELEWFARYNDNLFSYMSALNDGRGLDLTMYMKPPKRLNVRFKCLKDYGLIEVDGETRLLKKDGIYYLPLKQCEKLVQQGILEHIKS